MSGKRKYIYGIVNSNIDKSFGACLLDGLESGSNASNKAYAIRKIIEDSKESQISNNVYSILYKDISAVVSDSEIVDFTRMFKDALARLLVKHQKVIERIMTLGQTIIPMRLGTLAADETRVMDILNKGYSLIMDIFQKINNKIEIDVVSTFSDFSSVLREAGEEEEIKKFKERLLVNAKGITVDDQMKIGIMVKKAVDKKRDKVVFKISSALKNISLEIKTHEIMNDQMVMNTAFLIDKTRQKEFERAIENMNYEFGEMLNFKCIGPLPPYSFYTIEVEELKLNDVNWARNKLCLLADGATKDDIKKAYHRLAFSYHPDKNPQKPGIEKEFDEINKAYKLLINYCEACQQSCHTENCSFLEEEFKKNASLVKVRE